MIKTSQCPPLNRLFIVPRRERLKDICEKLPEPLVPGNIDKSKVRTRTKKANSITEMWLKKPAFVIESKMKEKEEALVAILDRKERERTQPQNSPVASSGNDGGGGEGRSNYASNNPSPSLSEASEQPATINPLHVSGVGASIPITIVESHAHKSLPKPGAHFRSSNETKESRETNSPLQSNSSSAIGGSMGLSSQPPSDLLASTNKPSPINTSSSNHSSNNTNSGNNSPTNSSSPSTSHQSGLSFSQSNIAEMKLAQLQQKEKEKEQANATNPAIKRIVSGSVPESRRARAASCSLAPPRPIVTTEKQKKEVWSFLFCFCFVCTNVCDILLNSRRRI
jgi:hypothetical protein